MMLVKFQDEPGVAGYVERGGFMLHLFHRRFRPPYGDGQRWTGGFALRVAGRYVVSRRWGRGL